MIDLQKLKGKFITFEGGEGTGKSTLSKMLLEEFTNQNILAIKTFDPGGSENSKRIREMLLSSKTNICKNAEMLLFSAARSQLTHDIIKPNLDDEITVICDRWFDSTIVYQGYCKGHNETILIDIFNYTCGVIPDITFILDIDPKIGLTRSYKVLNENDLDESKFEDLGLEFHKKVREGFLKTFSLNNNEQKTYLIDASKTIDECFEDIINILGETK